MEGTERRIKCTAVSGNPLPSLEWYRGGTYINATTTDRGESESYVSSEIHVKVSRTDNQLDYECRGQSEANPDNPVTKKISMTVQFPPHQLYISVEPENPVEGKSAVLTCKTDSSNHGVSLRWRYKGNLLPATDSVTRPGPFGGNTTTNLLHIDVTTEHVGAFYTCEAEHQASQTTVHNSTVLTIKCKFSIQFIMCNIFFNFFQKYIFFI